MGLSGGEVLPKLHQANTMEAGTVSSVLFRSPVGVLLAACRHYKEAMVPSCSCIMVAHCILLAGL